MATVSAAPVGAAQINVRPGSLRLHMLVLAGYLLLAILFTWPLVLQTDSHVMGGRLDNYEYIWKLGFVARALANGADPFFAPNIYFPFGYPLAYGEITPIHTVGMTPLTLLFGATVTYNFAVFASTILSGYAVFVMARRWLLPDRTSPLAAALICFTAGAAFAFSAFRMQKLTGHLPLFDTHWMVLALLFFDIWLRNLRLRDAALWGLFLGLAGLSSWYFVFMLGLLLPVYALAFAGSIMTLLRYGRIWTGLLVALGIAAALCIPFLIPYLQLDTGGFTRVPISDASFWAASPTDYLMPNPQHPIWGNAVRSLMWPFPGPFITEFSISIGWVTLLLALPGFRSTRGQSWRALKWMMLVAFILSLGPVLYLSRLPLDIPLPAQLLRELVPFADSVRSWGRFSVVVLLGCCLLAAAGLQSVLLSLPARKQVIWSAAALGLVLFGAWQGPQMLIPVTPRAIDHWLDQQPGNAPIMEFPLAEALSGPALFYTDIHGRPLTAGYGTYLPLLYRGRHPALTTFPSDESLDLLTEWGVEYVLVSDWALAYDASIDPATIRTQPRLEPLITLDGVSAYRLRSSANG